MNPADDFAKIAGIEDRLALLRRALKTPEGINAIIEQTGERAREYLEEYAAKIDDMDDIEVYVLSTMIGIDTGREKSEKTSN